MSQRLSTSTFIGAIQSLPQLVYAEPTYQYIIYSYISGETNYSRRNKRKMLKKLVEELINHYKPVSYFKGWGWTSDLTSSWQVFLHERIIEACKILEPYIPQDDLQLVLEMNETIKQTGSVMTSFLLYGDCGVHNFIFKAKQLVGVIDPTPIVGEPIYDLIYAFCSSSDELTKETISTAAMCMSCSKEINLNRLYKYVLIVLYTRIVTCLIHHPNDLEEYLKAWDYWRDLIIKNG